jgi:hypothetical protein
MKRHLKNQLKNHQIFTKKFDSPKGLLEGSNGMEMFDIPKLGKFDSDENGIRLFFLRFSL